MDAPTLAKERMRAERSSLEEQLQTESGCCDVLRTEYDIDQDALRQTPIGSNKARRCSKPYLEV